MKFSIDEQTSSDLELFEQAWDGTSVFSYFDFACSDGGKACMRRMFESPLVDARQIRERVDAMIYLGQLPFFLDIRREELNFIEIYLQQDAVPKRNVLHLTSRAVKGWLNPDNDCFLRQRAVPYLGRLIHELGTFMNELPMGSIPKMVKDLQQEVKKVLAREGMQYLTNQKKDSFWSRENLDLYFRGEELGGVRVVLDTLYMLDALRTVGTIAKEQGLTFPLFSGERRMVRIEGLYHLFLKEPVRNDVLLDGQRHLCFLTGPNMAGKSTYMKAFGVAVYLAHCGFPVPASRMELSPFRGLFTTINLSDNLSLGYSHYYNEVARVKYVVEQVRDLEDVVVVFDELFRGTNVKDAFDASRAVVGALARLKQGVFMISSHIVEVAGTLEKEDSVDFRFFDIRMENDEPRYTYHLREGVSEERIGMYILRKAGVVDLIESLK
ncbi:MULTISPECIES: MutS-related protein [Odoribacteraceae]|uniref:MutS-related protein n=1 Tax=Odoribacteraceae TaxID=1853231 RepID=UPI000E4F3C3B|nr:MULTISPECIES: hypothetical protein [Odoribacteraceae]MCQ4873699.1 hypothetical protein [Butyricimonas paravirosa]RHR75746.1 hypothetical protein DWW52_17360 [Odoribacter sp. AF15-53]